MKKQLFSAIAICFIFALNPVFAQNQKNALHIGGGQSDALYFGGFEFPLFELGYTRILNNRWSINADVNYSGGSNPIYHANPEIYAPVQSNIGLTANFLYSFSKNERRNNFQMGLGLAYLSVKTAYNGRFYSNNLGETSVSRSDVQEKRLFANICLQNDFKITPKLSVGMKIVTKCFNSGHLTANAIYQDAFQTYTSERIIHSRVALSSLLIRMGYYF
jgi:hypothetical protein